MIGTTTTLFSATLISTTRFETSRSDSKDGAYEHGICVSHRGGAIDIVWTTNSTATATFPVGNHPDVMTVLPDGSAVYVINHFGDEVAVVGYSR
jgi:DNA-binding beta-propeller fold protein YncE